MGYFEGLVETEDGEPVPVTQVGPDEQYVIDDDGFKRHVDAREVDRVVLAQFLEQLGEHKDEASAMMLQMMGRDDLFTKAAVDATLRNIDLDQVVAQRLPPDARQWLAMLGFKVVLNRHGEVVRVDLPAGPEDPDAE